MPTLTTKSRIQSFKKKNKELLVYGGEVPIQSLDEIPETIKILVNGLNLSLSTIQILDKELTETNEKLARATRHIRILKDAKRKTYL